MVGGDELTIDVTLDTASQALITTPAAGKFYRSSGPTAQLQQRLSVASQACLEWLPQENIIYNGARLTATTQVELAADSRFIGWDISCLGRPAAAERFERGRWRQTLELWRDGEPLFIERLRLCLDTDSPHSVANSPWGLRRQPVTATLLCVGPAAALAPLVDTLREVCLSSHPPGSVSLLKPDTESDVLVCRYLGPSSAAAKTLFTRLWAILRPAIVDRPASPPRVWAT